MRSEVTDFAKSLFSRREPGALLSLGLHIGTLLFALYSFSSAKPFDPAQESVPVDVVSEKEFSDMMKGEKTAEKKPEPMRRVDRVAETKEDKDPGQAKKDVDAPPPKAAEAPPPPPAKAEPEPVKPPPTPPSPPKLASVTLPPPPLRTTPPVKAPATKQEEDEEDEADAEVIKQKNPKKAEPKKEEPKPDLEKQRLEEKLKAEQKAAEDAKKKAEADAKAKAAAETREKAAKEAKAQEAKAQAEAKQKLLDKLEAEEDAREAAEAKAKAVAEAKAKADAAAKAQAVADAKAKAEAAAKAKAAADAKAKAAADAKAKADSESNKLNDAIRNRLMASREAPSSTGSTGAAVSRQASLGTTNASGKKLSPSDRSQLIGLLTDQMNRCISYSGSAPKLGPQITFTLNRDGSIAGGVQLANAGSEPTFRPFAEASMRALRNCQPYRIPARFLETYDDWKNVRLNIDTSDM